MATMKTPYADGDTMSREARQAALAGTRMMVLEECFDALIAALIASGAIPQNAASVMIEHLAERFIAHSEGNIQSDWQIDPMELRDQASRLRRAPVIRMAAAASQDSRMSP